LEKPNETPPVLLKQGNRRTQRDCEAYAENSAGYGSGELKFTFTDAIHGSTEVREVLGRLQHNKCCYCERKTSGRIDHFRPKGAIRQSKGSNRVRPGYYWLAYQWENLLLACEDCNLKKSDCFPLEDPRQRARNHLDHLDRETPLLLNPYEVTDPGEHLTFDGSACRPITARGRETITLLELNRPILQEERQNVLNTLEILSNVARHPDSPVTLRRAAREARGSYARPDASFSAMAREYLMFEADSKNGM
jgi:uncharacterized protein (TIGR02646 family)